jgi:hypothetical protein
VTLFSITYRMAFAHRNSNTGMLLNTRRLPNAADARQTSDKASIRTKAVSRTELSCAVFVTPRVGQSWVEDQEFRASR